MRVGAALAMHELLERSRDRWVLAISSVFALLASAVSLYGKAAEGGTVALTGPSLVTLAALLVPLVALILGHDAVVGERERNTLGMLLSLPAGRSEVVVAKFLGRAAALTLAVLLGLGVAIGLAAPGTGNVLAALVLPTVLLGLAFLAIGVLLSSVVRKQATAASLLVLAWFALVFFYDLALLGLLILTDGSVSQDTVAALVVANPAGLYRVWMMHDLAGPEVLQDLGMTASLPHPSARALLWLAWIAGPVAVSCGVLARTRAER
jgi:Cu-processing system permease protein